MIYPAEYFLRYILGIANPYDWQVECLKTVELGQRRLGGLKTAIVAPNGSGKTSNCIAPAILYFLTMFPSGQVPVTSSSWLQVEKQLFPALRKFKDRPIFEGWIFNNTEIKTPQGGFCIGFSTDNPGRAEGWHPKTSPDIDPVLYVLDEAKTVADGIFDAMSRCTLHHAIITSSPGNDSGKFYQIFHKSRRNYYRIKVGYEDCPHIETNDPGKKDRMRDELGEDHPVYRSSILGEFTELDGASAIPRVRIESLRLNPPEFRSGISCGGLDFAAGRDENVFASSNGNRFMIADHWSSVDTVMSRGRFIATARTKHIQPEHIAADGDGMGIPIINDLHADNFYVLPYRGGFPAVDVDHYVNIRAEAYCSLASAIVHREVILDIDDETVDQLCAPLLQYDSKGKLKIESKEDMKKRGVSSPDRADALVMCFWAWKFGTAGIWTGDGERPIAPDPVICAETYDFSSFTP